MQKQEENPPTQSTYWFLWGFVLFLGLLNAFTAFNWRPDEQISPSLFSWAMMFFIVALPAIAFVIWQSVLKSDNRKKHPQREAILISMPAAIGISGALLALGFTFNSLEKTVVVALACYLVLLSIMTYPRKKLFV